MRHLEGLAALREREFRLLFTGQAISLLGDRLTPVALAFAVLDLTGSPADLGYVLAAGWAPPVVLVLGAGVLADRVSRRALMLVADAARAASQGAMAALLLTGNARLWELIVLQAAAGAASAFFGPASTGLLPQTVSAELLQAANALRGISMWSAAIVGPALAGGLVAAAGPGWAIAVDAASFLVSAGFLGLLRLPALARPPGRRTALADLREGWREFSSRAWLWSVVGMAALWNALVAAPVDVLGPTLAKRELGGAGAWGLIVSLAGVGALLGGFLVLGLRPRRPLLVAVLAFGGTIPRLAFLAGGLPTAVVAAASLPAGAGVAVFGALWETTLQRHVPAEALSRVSAYDWLGSLAFLPLGSLAAGPVGAAVGIHATLWGSTALAAGAIASLAASPAIRRLRADQ